MFLEKRTIVGPFQCNCRILVCTETRKAAIIDAGDEPQKIISAIESLEAQLGGPLEVTHLLHTHAHLDHIGATRGVKTKKASRAQIALHRADHEIYQALRQQGQMFGIDYEDPLPVDHFLEHEEELQVGKMKFSIVHTPGHSPGSISIRLHDDTALKAQETLYTGDTLFQFSVGRTDLWGADQDQMFRSIRERILAHDDDARVCPGHGPDTTVGIEKRTNPFLV